MRRGRSALAASQPPSSRFSVTVICGNSWRPSATSATPARTISCVFSGSSSPSSVTHAAARDQAGERLQQRGLAGAVRAEDHGQPGLGFELQVAQHEEGAVARAQARTFRCARPEPPSTNGVSRYHITAWLRSPSRRRGRPRSPRHCAPPRPALASAILRPWCSTITRSTWRSSVRHRVLDPDDGEVELVAHAADQARHLFDLGLGQAGRDLVEQQQLGPRRERHADLEQALLRRRDRAPAGRSACGRRPISARMLSSGAQRPRHRRPPRPRRSLAPGRRPANCRPNSMLSRTVMSANTRGVWKVRAMPCAA